jgi:hypothetical protein
MATSAPPPNGSKGSQGGFTEKYLGINRLPPPSVLDVPASDLPMSITLGSYSLQLDAASGQWKIQDGLLQAMQSQITALQQQLQLKDREAALLSSSSSPSLRAEDEGRLLELERRGLELEKLNIQLLNDNNQLKFRSRILTAMCAIAEGDYRALCEEVGREADSAVKRVSTAGRGGERSYAFDSTQELKRGESFSRTQMVGAEAERTIKAPMRYQLQA